MVLGSVPDDSTGVVIEPEEQLLMPIMINLKVVSRPVLAIDLAEDMVVGLNDIGEGLI